MPDHTSQIALSLTDVRYRYPGSRDDTIAIDAFELASGEQALLTGGSGTGKSTLLHLIAGLMEPTGGEIRVAGRKIHALHGAARDTFRGRTIGMIFQTFNLLHGFSALENVMVPMMFSDIPKSKHRERATRLLERLSIDRLDAQPENLSIGQQQRVAVARALACEPALVLADEPTASLDPENTGEAMDLIQEVCREQFDGKGAALLCVSHDPAMAERFESRARLSELRSAGATHGHS